MSGGLLAFVGVSLVVIVTPGQDTALMIRNTIAGGSRRGVSTAFGVVSGQLVWTLATSAGLVALLRTSEPAFRALRLIGAAYLVYLGAQSLRGALGRGRDGVDGGRGARRVTSATAYRQGLISNLGNAKAAVFFASLLPQFVPASQPSFWQLFPLGVVFAGLTLAWLTAYAFAVAKAARVLRGARARRTIEAVTGTVLMALGLRLAAERPSW